MYETLLIASSWTLTKCAHYVLLLGSDQKRKQLIIMIISVLAPGAAMQVIDQPESFSLLNTLLFNIPASPGGAYSGSCAQVTENILNVVTKSFGSVFTAASVPIPWSDELVSQEYIIP